MSPAAPAVNDVHLIRAHSPRNRGRLPSDQSADNLAFNSRAPCKITFAFLPGTGTTAKRPNPLTSIPSSDRIPAMMAVTASSCGRSTEGTRPPSAYSRSSGLARNIAILHAARSAVAFRAQVENVPRPVTRNRRPSTSAAVTARTNSSTWPSELSLLISACVICLRRSLIAGRTPLGGPYERPDLNKTEHAQRPTGRRRIARIHDVVPAWPPVTCELPSQEERASESVQVRRGGNVRGGPRLDTHEERDHGEGERDQPFGEQENDSVGRLTTHLITPRCRRGPCLRSMAMATLAFSRRAREKGRWPSTRTAELNPASELMRGLQSPLSHCSRDPFAMPREGTVLAFERPNSTFAH